VEEPSTISSPDGIPVESDDKPLAELLSLLDDFDLWFNIVEP
jgi:alkyl sulfatase BDS1-like metallo-beta-lactamase superfamily hydrolase